MPSPDADSYADDLTLARTLADLADSVSLPRFGAADLIVESKPDLTPVSDADRAVEQALRDRLAVERPDDAVFGEEFGSSGTGSRRWVLDPIDGTKSFVRGVPVWATLIALLDGDEPVVGVASAPALGRRWWAAKGAGSWNTMLGGEPRRLSVSRVASLGDASLSYSSYVGDEGWGERAPALEALLRRVWRTRAYGDFWSHLLVAEGAVDIAVEPALSLWDIAALSAIVTEAGGRVSDLEGVDGVHGANAVTTNGLLHDAVVAALAI